MKALLDRIRDVLPERFRAPRLQEDRSRAAPAAAHEERTHASWASAASIRRDNFVNEIAKRLIEQLENGVAPWQKPWRNQPLRPAYNAMTGKAYKGLNQVILTMSGREDPRWLTFRQAQNIGASVRAGARGVDCQKWQFDELVQKRSPTGELVRDSAGNVITESVALQRPRMMMFRVFNAEQIDGMPPLPPLKPPPWDPCERAEQLLMASGATIQHVTRGGAFYDRLGDRIQLPARNRFERAEEYYDTAIHELGHWTGHDTRLNRDLTHPRGSAGYAREELRAEIASLMMSQTLGIGHHSESHAAYVGHWIQILRDDPKEILRAAADAEKIHGYLFELVPELNLQETTALTATPTVREQRSDERFYLTVGFEQKDEAKALGARWDKDQRSWYVPAGVDAWPFQQWWPKSEAQANTEKQHTYLRVDWAAKEEVKTLGARWDPDEKSWYVPAGVDPAPFEKWVQIPSPSNSSEQQPGRRNLAVPYGERVAAKAAGARWDPDAKVWFDPDGNPALERWLPSATNAIQEPQMSPKEELAQVLVNAGFKLEGDHPRFDGQAYRLSVEGDKQGEKSGVYRAYGDGHPAGYVRNYREGGEGFKWKSLGYTLTEAQRAELAADVANKAAERRAEQSVRHEKLAKALAADLASLRSSRESPTPYMLAKGLGSDPHAFTNERGDTILPGRDASGKQWTTQYIAPDGTKRFAAGARKTGTFYTVGGHQSLAKASALVIAEGYATAAEASRALNGHPVVAAFDAGNLKPVAQALQAQFHEKPILILADDDAARAKQLGRNPGLKGARDAAEAVGGSVLAPTFLQSAAGRDWGQTDFNDLARSAGRETVQRQIGPVFKRLVQAEVRSQAMQTRHARSKSNDESLKPQRRGVAI